MSRSRLPLHAICPYFAMFPEDFVREQVLAHTDEGDWVFDPFCGRGTTILESILLGRRAAGSDLNPVAFCVSLAKAQRPRLESVIGRVAVLEERYLEASPQSWEPARLALPPFFRRAFFATTLRELLFLRATLDWRRDRTDRFIMALALGSLHGEMDRSSAYFSNQMPRTICLKPEYSLRYWRRHRLYPKKRKVFEMLRSKAGHRLEASPDYGAGEVRQNDARRVAENFPELAGQVSLVVTSPPYLNVTRYEEDQWLRLWMLGGPPHPTFALVSRDDRHSSRDRYWRFLEESWAGLAPLLTKSARLVIRLGAIGMDENELSARLIDSLSSVFPDGRPLAPPKRSDLIGRQTRRFLPKSEGCRFEVDLVWTT